METLAYLYSVTETEQSRPATHSDDAHASFSDSTAVADSANDASCELLEDQIDELEQSIVWMMP
ncbi:MAG: hypothetical protein SFY66_26820 [Oculatellaceae cyanobacterium bins.114]|nr:hypothetical protein [Oculatellaceae cyanobacterium bins.114]